MAFETFKKQRAALTDDPAVTIQKRGTLSLNAPAYAVLGNPEALELLYDRESRLVALRKADASSDDAYIVRPLGRGKSTWLVSGKAFTRYYGIETENARRWPARMDDDMLVIDLKEPGKETSSNRDASEQARSAPPTQAPML
jgi:hypothetical protein